MSDFDMWADDPVLSPILRRMEEKERRYEEAIKRLQAHEERLNQHETVYGATRLNDRIERFVQTHPHVDRQQILQLMIQKAQQYQAYGVDPETVWREANREQELEAAREQARQEERERARLQPPSHQPQGMPELYVPGSRGKSWDDLEAEAFHDPEIRHILAGGEQP